MSFLEEALCSMEGPLLREGELRVLFLGPFALTEEVAELSRNWSRRLTSGLGWPVYLVVGDPTYSEMDVECRGFWFKPHAKKREDQVRKLRTQILAGEIHLLGLISKHRPRVVIGVQQSGIVTALAGLPLLLETACRLRAVPHSELAEFRRGWAGVQALLSVNPSVTPSTIVTSMEFLEQAIPELWKIQPRGVYRKIYTDGRYLHHDFARNLGGALGAYPSAWSPDEVEYLKMQLSTLPPRLHRE